MVRGGAALGGEGHRYPRTMRSHATGTETAEGMTFTDSSPIYSTSYLLDPVLSFARRIGPGSRVLDVGCGNGFWSAHFASRGCYVVGIDPSASGVAVAREHHRNARFEVMDVSANLLGDLGETPFDLVISTEVIEHVYSPQTWAVGCFNALRPGGSVVLSTPYHGWLKNVALAATGKLDRHLDADRVGGHIKFFSRPVLTRLLIRVGFEDIHFVGAGRVPLLWKSMVLAGVRPLP